MYKQAGPVTDTWSRPSYRQANTFLKLFLGYSKIKLSFIIESTTSVHLLTLSTYENVNYYKIFTLQITYYNSKNLNCIWALSFFYDSKRSIGEVLFLNQSYWSEIWSRKWNTWKNLEWFCCWTKWRVERKESGFLFISLFSREREIEVWKKFCRRATFFVHVRHFKAIFSHFLVKRFGYDLRLILGWFW